MLTIGEERVHFGYDAIRDKYLYEEKSSTLACVILFGTILAISIIIGCIL